MLAVGLFVGGLALLSAILRERANAANAEAREFRGRSVGAETGLFVGGALRDIRRAGERQRSEDSFDLLMPVEDPEIDALRRLLR